jgi:hypothetical protein
VERRAQALEGRGGGPAASRLELAGGLDQRVDGRPLGRPGLAQRRRAAARHGGVLGVAQLLARRQQVVDQPPLLAREVVRGPGRLGRLRQLRHLGCGIPLLGLAQLARGGIALARELLQREPVEAARDFVDGLSHQVRGP